MSQFDDCEMAHALGAGAVSPTSARVWLRTPSVREVELRVFEGDAPEIAGQGLVRPDDASADGTCAFDLTSVLSGGPIAERQRLLPSTRYRLELRAPGGDAVLASARFETAPDSVETTPHHFSFAIFSCHQPFGDEGQLLPHALEMLRASRRVLAEHDVKFALLMGDQIYADAPDGFSLFDPSYFERIAPPGRETVQSCTRHEIRALYQMRHRRFWGVREFLELQGACACYPTLDDHEILDNFGSAPEHSGPEWNALRLGALDAFYDYQVSRVLPRSAAERPAREFHYGFRYGACATFVMDLRSQRRATETETDVYSQAQLTALERFLRDSSDAKVLAIVTSVPVLYVDSWLANTAAKVVGQSSDVGDRWNFENCIRGRDRLLALLRAHQLRHPEQRVLLLGGDIHVGCAFRLDWDDGGPPLYQLTSSAISNCNGRIVSWIAECLPRTATRILVRDGERELGGNVELLEAAGDGKNPFGGLNLGIVDVHINGPRAQIEFKLYTTPEDREQPIAIFESGRF